MRKPLPLQSKVLFACSLTASIVLEYCVRHYDLWHLLWGRMDSLMHFLWGANFFLIFVLFLRWKPTDALLGVFAWQMGWESVEIIGDHVIAQPDYMLDIFYYDGVRDTILDLMGAAAAMLAIRGMRIKTKGSALHRWFVTFAWVVLPGLAVGAIVNIWYPASVIAMLWILVSAGIAALSTFKKRSS